MNKRAKRFPTADYKRHQVPQQSQVPDPSSAVDVQSIWMKIREGIARVKGSQNFMIKPGLPLAKCDITQLSAEDPKEKAALTYLARMVHQYLIKTKGLDEEQLNEFQRATNKNLFQAITSVDAPASKQAKSKLIRAARRHR